MSAHSVPLHCPYCAGENLHPHRDAHGAWECRECLRAFSVKFHGLLQPQIGSTTTPRTTDAGADAAGDDRPAPTTPRASTSGGPR